MSSKDKIAVSVKVLYLLTKVTKEANLTLTLQKENKSVYIDLTEMLDLLIAQKFDFAQQRLSVSIGESPFTVLGKFPIKDVKWVEINSAKQVNINIKATFVVPPRDLIITDFASDDIKNDEEETFNSQKLLEQQKRAKERKIGNIVEKVYIWRKLFSGYTTKEGQHLKLTLEEASRRIGISKKSLDDYLIQIK